MTKKFVYVVFLLGCLVNVPSFAQDQAELTDLINRATQKAIAKVEPTIVQLDLFSSNPKEPKIGTGLAVSPDGQILTSAWFVKNKETRVVANIGGKKVPAEIVGIDRNRLIALLQVKNAENLAFAKLGESVCRVGETAIAVGKTLSAESANVSTGIISAKRRLFGIALQTDAKVGPANYGGPLISLSGEILGILTPVMPGDSNQGDDQEWYDSGIGFAIPSADAHRSITRIKKRNGDISRGRIGIRFITKNQYRDKLIVASCFPRSPAAKAGIKPDDLIVRVNGLPVANLAQFKIATHGLYGKDKITIEAIRNNQNKTFELLLADKLSLYRFPYVGFVPDLQSEGQSEGVTVATVDENGPAKNKLESGDRIVGIGSSTVSRSQDLDRLLAQHEAGGQVTFLVKRNGKTQKVEIELQNLASELTKTSYKFPKTSNRKTESNEIRVSGFANRSQLVLPSKEQEAAFLNLVVVLANSKTDARRIIDRYEGLAQQNRCGLLIAFPSSVDGWENQEKEFLALAIQKAKLSNPRLGNTIIVAAKENGKLACQLILGNRGIARGIVFVNPESSGEWNVPLPDPGQPLHTLVVANKGSMREGLQLLKRLIGGGMPAKLTEDGANTISILLEWIWLTNRY